MSSSRTEQQLPKPLTDHLKLELSIHLLSHFREYPLDGRTLYKMAIEALDWLEEKLGGLFLVPNYELDFEYIKGVGWTIAVKDL